MLDCARLIWRSRRALREQRLVVNQTNPTAAAHARHAPSRFRLIFQDEAVCWRPTYAFNQGAVIHLLRSLVSLANEERARVSMGFSRLLRACRRRRAGGNRRVGQRGCATCLEWHGHGP